MDTYIGQKIEQYKIESKIGSGSSGTVYRATDLNLVRPVVLKLLKPSLTKQPARQKQILKAAQAASRLSHPAIVPFYNFGQQNEHFYLVTAHVEGISLERLFILLSQGERVLRLDESLHIIAQIADGLGYAHQAGIHHGDLKPGNILLKPLERPLRSGDPAFKAMLADFGLSPIPDSGIPDGLSPEQVRPLQRYLPYLAPERQAGQPANGRADIYSLGVVLHQLISGQLPNHKHPLRDLCPGVPSNIIEIVEKATAYVLADRYQLAEKMGDDLRLAASRLTAADTLLFAPQATVSDFDTLLAASKDSTLVQPATRNLGETAVPYPSSRNGQNENEEEATPTLQPDPTGDPSHTIIQTSPPPAVGDQIIITGQGRAPRHFSMNKPQITVGRAPDNDIVLSSPDVSRQHARLEQQNNGWTIVDAKSRGGTFYDGRKLRPKKPEKWQPGLRLQMGPYFLQWQLAEEVASNSAQSTPAEPVTELFQISADGSQVQASNSSFSVALNPTQATLAPGEEAHLQIDLFNQSSTMLVLKINLTGLPDIATLAQDTVSITPGGRATVPLTLQLPIVEQPLLAGQHPFQLLLQAEGPPPIETAVLQGQLTILPEETFELSIWPAQVQNGGTCRIMVRNDGNVRSTLHLTTQDAAGKLQFFGDEQPMELDPGGTATTAYRITHRKKRPFFGRVRQIPFEVEIRSNNGRLQNKLGHLELRPRFPAWVLPLIQLLLVLLLIAVVLNSVLGSRQNPVGNIIATPVLDEGTAVPTDPLLVDSDDDGLSDFEELNQYQTDPALADTDLDGVSDGDEVAAGSDPLRFQAGGETAVADSTPSIASNVPSIANTPSSSEAPTLIPQITAAPSNNETTVEIVMLPEQSGWLSSSGEVNTGSSNMPRTGDLEDGTAVRGLLTFSLNDLPSNATIRTAFLRFSNDPTIEGDPFTALGCLQIEFVEVSQPLDNTAYDALGFFISCEISSPSSIDIAFDVEDALVQGQSQLNFRLGFETESNGDAVADLYTVRTAPILEVTYLLP